jgi:hypothetical protein
MQGTKQASDRRIEIGLKMAMVTQCADRDEKIARLSDLDLIDYRETTNFEGWSDHSSCGQASFDQRHDRTKELTFREHQPPNGDRQGEAPRAGAAWIEVKHAVLHFHSGTVGMPRDNCVKSGRRRIDVEFLHIVQDVHATIVDLNDFGLRQCVGPGSLVDIAANCKQWCDRPQAFEHVWAADVARMDDQGAIAQRRNCPRPQQPMGIRYDANVSFHVGYQDPRR